MKRYTKAENIKDLIEALNEKRKRQHKRPVARCWTGAGHWLKEPAKDKFIGFLEGLLYEPPKR